MSDSLLQIQINRFESALEEKFEKYFRKVSIKNNRASFAYSNRTSVVFSLSYNTSTATMALSLCDLPSLHDNRASSIAVKPFDATISFDEVLFCAQLGLKTDPNPTVNMNLFAPIDAASAERVVATIMQVAMLVHFFNR